jgi:hypothetical protein
MSRNALCLVLLLLSSVFAGCTEEQTVTEEEEEQTATEEEEVSPYDQGVTERGLQERTDVYLYTSGGLNLGTVETCPLYGDFNSPAQPMISDAIATLPIDGIDSEGMAKIYEPESYESNIAIMIIDQDTFDRSSTGNGSEGNMVSKSLLLAQMKNASALIWTIKERGESCDELEDVFPTNMFQSISGLLDIPLIIINPADANRILTTPNRILQIGPEGFVPQEVLIDDNIDQMTPLVTKRVSIWEEQHQDCPSEYAGAMVKTLFEDINQDGEFQISEQSLDVKCLIQSPYADGIVSISLERNEIEVPTTECVSGIAIRFDVITTRESGVITTELGSDTGCDGLTPESFENQLKRLLCENGHLPDETTLSEMTLSSCLSPLFESELRLVIPQLKVDSMTSSQMPICSNGGLLITMWADTDGNGEWAQSETQSTQRLCNGNDGGDGANGSAGQDGTDGTDGLDGYDLIVDSQNADSISCPSSVNGKEVFLGRDINRNGVLENIEIEHSYAICDGLSGANGSDGQTALLEADVFENLSSSDCNGVYVRLNNGFDLDNNSNLSNEEILGSRTICLPSQQTDVNATFVKESIEPNSVCLNGGIHSFIWIDEDANDARTPEEIFMETFDCAPDEEPVQCDDADGDCVSDEDESGDGNARENIGDSDFDGVNDDEDEYPDCDNRIDSDRDGIPDDCEDDI